MKILQVKAPVNFNLFTFGDSHEGSILFHEKGFNVLLDMMNSEYDGYSNNLGIHHSDGIEGIMIDDKRFEPQIHTTYDGKKVVIPSVTLQRESHVKRLEPIKDKLITMLEGNHHEKLWRNDPVTQLMCRDLGIPYGTWTCKIIFNDRRNKLMFKSYHTHGRRTINSNADDIQRREDNMKLILKRQLEDQMGDCVLMAKGHCHKLLIRNPLPRLYITDDGEDTHQAYTKADHTADWIHPDHRYYVATGSFLKIYGKDMSGYAEKAEYKPNELGFAITKVRDRKIVGIDKIVV